MIELDDVAFLELTAALEWHSDGWTRGTHTVRACWDADRLDLPRCGILPEPRRMATPEGARLALNLAASFRACE